MAAGPTVDLILPFYRPHDGWEAHLLENCMELVQFFQAEGAGFGVIVVDDGSPAGSFDPEAVNRLRAAIPGFRFLAYAPNRGKGHCLRYGVAASEARFQIYSDGDLPFGTEAVKLAWKALQDGAQVVMGVRGAEYSELLSGTRRFLSRTVRALNRRFLGLPLEIADTQAGLKGFDPAGKGCFLSTRTDSFLFDTEFIFYASRCGLRIVPIRLTLRPGLHFSRMGLRVMFREGMRFLRLWVAARLFGRIPAPAVSAER